jgi:hypothetical protein
MYVCMYVCVCVCEVLLCYVCAVYCHSYDNKYLLTTVIKGLKNNTALYRYMVYYGFRASAVLVLL